LIKVTNLFEKEFPHIDVRFKLNLKESFKKFKDSQVVSFSAKDEPAKPPQKAFILLESLFFGKAGKSC